jgi:hypothetical protein
MPVTIEAIIILALFLAPGFICRTAMWAGVPQTFVSNFHTVVISLTFSVVVHLVASFHTLDVAPKLAALFGFLKAGKFDLVAFEGSVVVWVVCVLFLYPVVIAFVLSKIWMADWIQSLMEHFGLSKVQRTPTSWDWFFLTEKQGSWIVAELDDGTRIGGEFGEGSFASLSPHSKDIYIESIYDVDVDHNFGQEIPDNIGAVVNGEKITKLAFYRAE